MASEEDLRVARKLVEDSAIAIRRGTGRRREHADATVDVEFISARIATAITAARAEGAASAREHEDVQGSKNCPLCVSDEPHNHPELMVKGQHLAIMLGNVQSLHHASMMAGRYLTEMESKARAEQREVDAGICDAGAMLASEPMGAPEIKRVLESAAAAIRAGKE